MSSTGSLSKIRQKHLSSITSGQRYETTLRQTALQRHLTAFETDFMKTASTRFLTFVATSRSLAQAATDATTNAAPGAIAASGRFNSIKLHLALALHEIIDLVDHAAISGRIQHLHRMIHTTQAQDRAHTHDEIAWYQ